MPPKIGKTTGKSELNFWILATFTRCPSDLYLIAAYVMTGLTTTLPLSMLTSVLNHYSSVVSSGGQMAVMTTGKQDIANLMGIYFNLSPVSPDGMSTRCFYHSKPAEKWLLALRSDKLVTDATNACCCCGVVVGICYWCQIWVTRQTSKVSIFLLLFSLNSIFDLNQNIHLVWL